MSDKLSEAEIKRIADAKLCQATLRENIAATQEAIKKMKAFRAQGVAAGLDSWQENEFRLLKELWSTKMGSISVIPLDELFPKMEEHIENLNKMLAD